MRIWSSHGHEYEDYGFVGCDALKFLKQDSTFRTNLLPGAAKLHVVTLQGTVIFDIQFLRHVIYLVMTPNAVLTIRNLNSAVYFHNRRTYGVCRVCPGRT